MAEEKRLQIYQCPCCSDSIIRLDQFDTDEAEYKVHRDKCDWRGQVVEFQGHSIQEHSRISSDRMHGKFEKDVGNKMSKMDDRVTSRLLEAQQMQQVSRQMTEELMRMEEQQEKFRERAEKLEREIRARDRIIALKDVTLAEQDLRIQALEQASYDGILVWKISDFTKKRQDALSGRTTSLYSPCFFTSRHGYKMCARIYLNGDGMGKGNHISLSFVIMKGPFDALLRWPFKQKVTFMVLDQNNREHIIDAFCPDPTSSSFQRPTSDMNIASGCPLFMQISQIDSSHHAYVNDDVMFIKIIVDTSDLA